MDLSEEAIEQEHRDFLRKIANEVYDLVRDQTNMARFRRQLKLFCEKNEEHQKEVELLKKASSNDPKLHDAIKKKEKEKWGKTWEEMTEEERNNCYPISLCTRKLEGEKHYVYHEYIKDLDDNNCYHYNSFWGQPAKTASLLDFLITPPLRRDDFEQYYWDFEFSKQPDDDERTICCYTLLTAVHDIQVSDKPIFPANIYNGACRLRNKWKNILWKICIGSTWSSIPSCRIEGLSDIRAWIQRALSDVKADLDRNKQKTEPQEKDGQIKTNIPDNKVLNLAKVPISRLIEQGESHTLEFKETLYYDTQTERKNKDILLSSLKTIAGFLNAAGGTLLIGVDDSGKIKGIGRDLNIMKNGNNDKFQLKIRNCLKDRFRPQPIGNVNISFEKFPEGTICRVDVQTSKDIIHLDNKVYVREGNTTQLLDGRTLTEWIEKRKRTQ